MGQSNSRPAAAVENGDAAPNVAPQTQARQAQNPYVSAQQVSSFQRIPPSLIPFSRPWHIAKLVLGGSSIVVSVILIAVAIALASMYSDYGEAISDVVTVSVLGGVAIIWQVAENITICARAGHRGIHPGAHVGVHLLIAIGAALALSFLSIILANDVETYQYVQSNPDSNNCDPYSDSCYSNYDGYGGTYYASYYGLSNGAISSYIAMEATLVAFSAILFMIHIALFVRACIETHQRNSIGKTIILIPQGAPIPAFNGPVTYMTAPPEMSRFSYAPTQQPPMQEQQAMQQAIPVRRSGSAAAADASYSARQGRAPAGGAADQRHLYGFYAPASSPQTMPSPIVGNSTRSRPESSVASPSPVSEPRQSIVDKGKQPEVAQEYAEASRSGSGAA